MKLHVGPTAHLSHIFAPLELSTPCGTQQALISRVDVWEGSHQRGGGEPRHAERHTQTPRADEFV